MRRFALGGAIGPAVLLGVAAIAGTLRPGYSHLDQFISELGATGTSHAGLLNYAGFIPTGVLFVAFAISTLALEPRTRVSLLGTALLLLFAVGAIVAGIASCDVGCPQGSGSLSNVIHDTVSPLAFLALIVASGVLGMYFRGVPEWRPIWLYSIATSLVSLGFMAALVASLESRRLTGLWQRLVLITLFAWTARVGIRQHRLLARRSSGRTAADP